MSGARLGRCGHRLPLLLLALPLLALPLWGCHLIFPFDLEAGALDGAAPDAVATDARNEALPTRDVQADDLVLTDGGLDQLPVGPVLSDPSGPQCIGAQQVALFSVKISDPNGSTPAVQWSAPDGSFKSLGLGHAEYSPPAAYAMICPRTITFTATATNIKAKVTWSLQVTRAADFNRDGAVDGNDFLIYQTEQWSTCCATGSNICKADANNDCAVDVSDYNIWNSEQGSTGCKCP